MDSLVEGEKRRQEEGIRMVGERRKDQGRILKIKE